MLPSARKRQRSPLLYIRAPSRLLTISGKNFSAVKSGRPTYPKATPSPDMHSSPETPIGTGDNCASRMYSRMFEIGRPIGTEVRFQDGRHSQSMHPIDVSVGP